jgi:hypothetical protein
MTTEFIVHAVFIASGILSVACFVAGFFCIRIMHVWAGRMAIVMFAIAIILNWMAYEALTALVVSVVMFLISSLLYWWYWGGGRELRWSRHPQITTDSDKEA